MEKWERMARPILIPLILGKPSLLGAAEQKIVASWIALKMMVLEHSHPPDVVLTWDDRRDFCERDIIPDGLKIRIVLCGEGHWTTCSYRDCWTASLSAAPPAERARKNIQTTTVGVGSLLIHATASRLPGFDLDNFVPIDEGIIQIWPIKEAAIWWPRVRINAAAGDALASRLEVLAARPRTYFIP